MNPSNVDRFPPLKKGERERERWRIVWGVEEIEFFRHFSKQVLEDGEGNSASSELRSFAVRVDESLVNSQFVPFKVVTIVMNSGTAV